MKFFKIYFFILIIFFETGNVLSVENIFNVNNIELSKNPDISNEQLANQAIKLAFKELKKKYSKVKNIKSLKNLSKEEKDQIKYWNCSYQYCN